MATQHDNSSVSDEKLVRAAQRGDMPAFEELVARHRDKIYARAFSMMRSEEDAVDLSQEAWVKGWQRLKQFQGDSSFVTWMTRIVINLCLDQLRRRSFTELLSADWKHGVEAAVDVALLGRYYERIADHAVSVANRVVFVVTGEQPNRD